MLRSKLRYANIFSADVALGALAGGAAAAGVMDVSLPLVWWIAFPLCVWAVYTADHLSDSQKGKQISLRRWFHRRYAAQLRILCGCAAIAVALCAAFAPGALWKAGAFVAMMAALHLFIAAKRLPAYPKEFGVAVVYAAGVWAGPAALAKHFSSENLLLFLQFLLLTFYSLLVFSHFDRENDRYEGQPSMLLKWGEERSRLWMRVSGLSVVAPAFFQTGAALRLAVTYTLIAVLHALMLALPAYFRRRERFRRWGDGAFVWQFFSLFR